MADPEVQQQQGQYHPHVDEPVPSLVDSGSSSKSSSAMTSMSVQSESQRQYHHVHRGSRERLYDKHNTREVPELPMQHISLPAKYSNPQLTIGKSAGKQVAASYAPYSQAHGLELDGRSGTVKVSSLLPSARPSQPPMASQQFLVQQIPNGRSSREYRSSMSAESLTQIRLASPEMRARQLQHQQQSHQQSTSPDLPSLADRLTSHDNTQTGAAQGDAPMYYADSETEGCHGAALTTSSDLTAASNTNINTNNNSTGAFVIAESNLKARSISEVSRASWNEPSDSEGSHMSERQRRRLAVRASVTTEKYYVRSVAPGGMAANGVAASNGFSGVGSPVSVGAAATAVMPLSPLTDIASELYEESSADDEPVAADRDLVAAQAEAQRRQASKQYSLSLEHRANSFDFGRARRSMYSDDDMDDVTRRDIALQQQQQQQSMTELALTMSNHVAFDDESRASNRSFGRSSTHSSTRRARESEKRARRPEIEAGYDGDVEGLMRSAGRGILMTRRNTVAGDKIDMLTASRSSTNMRPPRNTGDFSDMTHARDEKRTLRGSRRRSAVQAFIPIGTQIAPGHVNYVLMYNMLTGIRVSVSRCESKDARPVRPEDYMAAHKYSFDVVGDEMTPSSRYDFKFKDYAPW
ncbi:Phosphatidylinositol-4-phosphate 5-kinase, partial [Linderina pennispora]